jgi:hypothetical protein
MFFSETRKDCCDRVAQVLEEVMIEAGRDILDPVPVMVDTAVCRFMRDSSNSGQTSYADV